MLSSLRRTLAAITLGLAGAAFVAPASLSAQEAAEQRDYECFVLLQDRRTAINSNTVLEASQRAQIVNNLAIVTAYYAGIISRHPYHVVTTNLANARRGIDAATDDRRDVFATQCTSRYLAMVSALAASSAQPAAQE